MSAMAVKLMAIPITARFHTGSAIQSVTGDPGCIRSMVNTNAEIMNARKRACALYHVFRPVIA
jgi:hypothetical protein